MFLKHFKWSFLSLRLNFPPGLKLPDIKATHHQFCVSRTVFGNFLQAAQKNAEKANRNVKLSGDVPGEKQQEDRKAHH